MFGCLVVVSAVVSKPLNKLFMLKTTNEFSEAFWGRRAVTSQSLSNNHSAEPPVTDGSWIKSNYIKYQLVKYISVIYVEPHFILTLMQTELCHA